MLSCKTFINRGGKFFIIQGNFGYHVEASYELPSENRRYTGVYQCDKLSVAKKMALKNMFKHRERHLVSARQSNNAYIDIFTE